MCRSTVFAIFFSITGYILATKSLLNNEYVLLIGAIQSLVVVRAIGDDMHERETRKIDQNNDSK
jgi:hypothetical protein